MVYTCSITDFPSSVDQYIQVGIFRPKEFVGHIYLLCRRACSAVAWPPGVEPDSRGSNPGPAPPFKPPMRPGDRLPFLHIYIYIYIYSMASHRLSSNKFVCGKLKIISNKYSRPYHSTFHVYVYGAAIARDWLHRNLNSGFDMIEAHLYLRTTISMQEGVSEKVMMKKFSEVKLKTR